MLNHTFSCHCQYESHILPTLQPSACGPTVVASILRYYEQHSFSINRLYKKLHCTRLGLPSLFLLYFLPKIIGPNWIVEKTNLLQALEELKQQRVVALKFDRYFNRKFWRKPYFSYHWTVLVDYDFTAEGLYLIVEDLGTPNRPSNRQRVLYETNMHALTFIKLHPKQRLVDAN